jgi:microcystin-dependent protein
MYISEIRMFAFAQTPGDWAPCQGQELYIHQHQALFSLIGNAYGGDGRNTFRLPDLRGRVVIGAGKGDKYPAFAAGGSNSHQLSIEELPRHTHQAVASSNASTVDTPQDHHWPSDAGYVSKNNALMSPLAVSESGGNQSHENMSPYLSINYCIALRGEHVTKQLPIFEDYLGAIRLFCYSQEENTKWLRCDGRLLPVGPFPGLFSLIGTTYGGDGISTFALPDLSGRAMVAYGGPAGLTAYELGQKAGEESVQLTTEQMPAHKHVPMAQLTANSQRPDGQVWGSEAGRRPPVDSYAAKPGEPALMNSAALSDAGGDKPHNNMMAYQTFIFMICANDQI